jgi:hypothetical protein
MDKNQLFQISTTSESTISTKTRKRLRIELEKDDKFLG